jgi:TRAP-type C4-dicarboxylate transport system permease small subunit
MPRTSDSAFVRAMDFVYLACMWLAGIAITVMSLVIPWGVFSRYVLGEGSQWPEPVAILLMMVFTFIGAACAYRAGGHIAVQMFTELMPRALQAALAHLVNILMAVASLFVAWYGIQLCIGTWNQTIAEVPWLPVGATYASLPLGSIVTLLFVLERMICGAQDHRPIVRYEEQLVEVDHAGA